MTSLFLYTLTKVGCIVLKKGAVSMPLEGPTVRRHLVRARRGSTGLIYCLTTFNSNQLLTPVLAERLLDPPPVRQVEATLLVDLLALRREVEDLSHEPGLNDHDTVNVGDDDVKRIHRRGREPVCLRG